MTTLGVGWRRRKLAIPWAAKRTFWKVKSSAMMPRQPSVPNLIDGFSPARTTVGCSMLDSVLDKVLAAAPLELGHQQLDLLDPVPGTDQDGVVTRAKDEVRE